MEGVLQATPTNLLATLTALLNATGLLATTASSVTAPVSSSVLSATPQATLLATLAITVATWASSYESTIKSKTTKTNFGKSTTAVKFVYPPEARLSLSRVSPDIFDLSNKKIYIIIQLMLK